MLVVTVKDLYLFASIWGTVRTGEVETFNSFPSLSSFLGLGGECGKLCFHGNAIDGTDESDYSVEETRAEVDFLILLK